MWFIDLLKELHKQGATAMGLATIALIAVAYHQVWTLPAMELRTTGVEQGVQSIQVSQLEEKLEKTETALCMNRGDPGLLERRRELREQYEKLTGHTHTSAPCELLVKLAH